MEKRTLCSILNQIRFDIQLALYDGKAFYHPTELLINLRESGKDSPVWIARDRYIFDLSGDSEEATYTVMIGSWDDSGKFWPY